MALNRIVALGDSVARGTGSADHAYPELVGTLTEQTVGYPIEVTNLAVNGWTSWTLRWEIQNSTTMRWHLNRTQAVLVTVGANDLVSLAATRRVTGWGPTPDWLIGHSITSVDRCLRDLRRRAPGAIICVTGYWNVFRDGAAEPNDEARAWSRAVTDDYNNRLHDITVAAGAHFVDLTPVFRPTPAATSQGFLDDDGEHPNQIGHHLIAHQVAATLLPACGLGPGANTTLVEGGAADALTTDRPSTEAVELSPGDQEPLGDMPHQNPTDNAPPLTHDDLGTSAEVTP